MTHVDALMMDTMKLLRGTETDRRIFGTNIIVLPTAIEKGDSDITLFLKSSPSLTTATAYTSVSCYGRSAGG